MDQKLIDDAFELAETMLVNEYEGFSLFNDIEDKELRQNNRAVVMANMFEMHSKEGHVNKVGLDLLGNYFGYIPEDERGDAFSRFLEKLLKAGVQFDVTQFGAQE